MVLALAYIALFFSAGISIGFFGAMLVDNIIIWRRERQSSKERVWEELKRDYKPRKPVAK
jgi:hypothetical protein